MEQEQEHHLLKHFFKNITIRYDCLKILHQQPNQTLRARALRINRFSRYKIIATQNNF
jgi:hypothetical protein